MPDQNKFVNPYQFVPLPSEVKRRRPPGHDGSGPGQLFSGRLELTWTLRTPMLLPRDAAVEVGGSYTIPGSSIKGVLRSVHEAMFGGCLRVADLDYIPVHREPAQARWGDWRLGRVLISTANGRPLRIQLCKEVAWVDAASLMAAYPRARLPATGDIAAISGLTVNDGYRPVMQSVGNVTGLRRPEVASGSGDHQDKRVVTGGLDQSGNRVILVTDTAARESRNPVYWASGILTRHHLAVADDVVEELQFLAAGTEDRRTLSPGGAWESASQKAPVHWPADQRNPANEIGERNLSTGLLFPGDVVWVRVEDDKIVDISLSYIWRYAGQGAVEKRIPRSLRACDDPESLCLSCEVFGSAEERLAGGGDDGDGTEEAIGAEQLSYAGHVRFGGAHSVSIASVELVDLAPLGQPRLSAGGFYLQSRSLVNARRRNDMPAHWGSSPDQQDGLRQMRGRKFYWHADPRRQRTERHLSMERYRRRPDQQQQDGERVLLPAGTQFRGVVIVDGISRPGLQSLLAVLHPERVLGPGCWCHHLGGGKPFGLGTAEVTVSGNVVATAERYLGKRHEPGSIGTTALDPMVDTNHLDSLVDAGARPALRRLLAQGGLGDLETSVSYPTTSPWSSFGTRPFDESFNFFSEYSGQKLRVKNGKDQSKEWRPLPQIGQGNQLWLES